jgi:hypothetical protein
MHRSAFTVRRSALAVNPDSEAEVIVLVLVVVLVLDLWDFGAEKRARSFDESLASAPAKSYWTIGSPTSKRTNTTTSPERRVQTPSHAHVFRILRSPSQSVPHSV